MSSDLDEESKRQKKKKRAKKMERWRKDREDRRRQEQLYEKEYLSGAHTAAGGKDFKISQENLF